MNHTTLITMWMLTYVCIVIWNHNHVNHRAKVVWVCLYLPYALRYISRMLHAFACSMYHMMQPTNGKQLVIRWYICFKWIWSRRMDAWIIEFSIFDILYHIYFSSVDKWQIVLTDERRKEKLIVPVQGESCLWKQTDKILCMVHFHHCCMLHRCTLAAPRCRQHAAYVMKH